jgi:hypothetical protein
MSWDVMALASHFSSSGNVYFLVVSAFVSLLILYTKFWTRDNLLEHTAQSILYGVTAGASVVVAIASLFSFSKHFDLTSFLGKHEYITIIISIQSMMFGVVMMLMWSKSNGTLAKKSEDNQTSLSRKKQ